MINKIISLFKRIYTTLRNVVMILKNEYFRSLVRIHNKDIFNKYLKTLMDLKEYKQPKVEYEVMYIFNTDSNELCSSNKGKKWIH